MNPLVIKSRHSKTAVFKEAGCLSVVLRVVLRVVLLENVLLILRHAVKLEGMSFTAVDDIDPRCCEVLRIESRHT